MMINTEESIMNCKQYKLLYFMSEDCNNCRMMASVIDRIAVEYPGIEISRIFVDNFPEKAVYYSVNSIPTIILVDEHNEIYRNVGFIPYDSLKKRIDFFIE